MPSVADLLFLAILALFAVSPLSVRLLGDAGIGWHIRTGQWILAHHAIPRLDLFSSTMAGRPWFAWEWLYDALVGALDRAAGLNGVVALTALVTAFTFSWSFLLLLRGGTHFLLALVLILLAVSASTIHFLARPHVFSWMFAVIWFSSLEGSQSSVSRWRLWLLPALTILWVNVHAGFLLGFALLGISWVGALWQSWRRNEGRFEDVLEDNRAGKRALELTLVSGLSALATLLNPYGWRLHQHIYCYLTNRFLMNHIEEFQSPNFHGVAQQCFAVILLLSILALAIRRQTGRARITQVLVVLFAIDSGLYASRNIPTSSLLLILVTGPALSRAAFDLKKKLSRRLDFLRSSASTSAPFLQRMQFMETSCRGHLWPACGALLVVGVALHGGRLGPKLWMDAHFSPQRFPVNAVDFLKAGNLPGPILAPDSWGGYLIYRLDPERKVVLDDRHDLYGENFLKSYLVLIHAEPGWNQFLDQHPPGCIVVSKKSPVVSLLSQTASWQQVYADETAAIFLPRPRK